jgi:PiT family inorganic phosphate transporter
LHPNADIPIWVIAAAASALSLGTATGGARIMRTLGRKVIQMDPARAFIAQTTASTVLFIAAAHKAPISTTHVITTSIMGAGATKKFSAVKWGVARNIVFAWVLTLPAAGGVAALFYVVLKPILV